MMKKHTAMRKGAAYGLILAICVFSACILAMFTVFFSLICAFASSGDIGRFIHCCAALAVLCAAIFFAFIWVLLVKFVRPLCRADKLLFEAYDGIQPKPGFLPVSQMGIDEVLEAVINHQKGSSNRELTANLLRHKAELSQLQSQINPHFLYNTLESVRGYALMKGVREIADMVEALSQLFRNNTRKMGLLIPLSDEIKNVDNYMLIQKFRFQDRFSFEKKIEGDKSKLLSCLIPSFIIQPVLENCISHALESMASGGMIQLYIHSTQSRLIIQVQDNGVGIADDRLCELITMLNSDQDTAEPNDGIHVGIGISNINQRIKMQYGYEYGLSIASTLNIGTQVEITLPLQ